MAGSRKKSDETADLAEEGAAASAGAEPAPAKDLGAAPLVPDAEVIAEAPVEDRAPAELPDPSEERPDPASTSASAPPVAEPARQPGPPPEPSRGGNPLMLVLGGVVAAGLGFGLAQVVPNGWPLASTGEQLASIESRLAAQDQKLAALAPDQTLADRIATLEARVQGLPDPTADLAALRAELADLKQQASAPAADLAPDIAALKAEIATLRGEVSAIPKDGSAELQALKAAAQAEREAAEARAAALRAEAEATARSAVARGAVLRVQAALDAGGAFDTALDDLGSAGITVPAALSAHAQGLLTLAQLQTAFPDAARAVLAATQKPGADATVSERLGAFLKAQTGMRALTPQEGGYPDAILSRAEAALHKGDLTGALAELDALPPEGAAAMADWRAKADARAEAAAALATLATDLNAK